MMDRTVLIIGGAFQNKTEVAFKKYSLTENDFYTSANPNGIIVDSFASFYRDYKKDDASLIRFLKNKIIICDEIGCGIVPLSKEDRLFREKLGRFLCLLAEEADTVLRVQCGIAIKIKGA